MAAIRKMSKLIAMFFVDENDWLDFEGRAGKARSLNQNCRFRLIENLIDFDFGKCGSVELVFVHSVFVWRAPQ